MGKLNINNQSSSLIVKERSFGIYFDFVLAERLKKFLDEYEHRQTPLEDWLTGDVVEDMLDISERTLVTLRSCGKLPFSKIGNKIYYRRSDVEKMLDDGYSKKEKEAANG